MWNSGDNNFSSIIALLKALHCQDLLRVIALLFRLVNSMGIYLHNITSPALTQHCRGTQKVTAPPISPAILCHPHRCVGGGSGYKWMVHNTVWIAHTEIGLDPINSVIKRLWFSCFLSCFFFTNGNLFPFNINLFGFCSLYIPLVSNETFLVETWIKNLGFLGTYNICNF